MKVNEQLFNASSHTVMYGVELPQSVISFMEQQSGDCVRNKDNIVSKREEMNLWFVVWSISSSYMLKQLLNSRFLID